MKRIFTTLVLTMVFSSLFSQQYKCSLIFTFGSFVKSTTLIDKTDTEFLFTDVGITTKYTITAASNSGNTFNITDGAQTGTIIVSEYNRKLKGTMYKHLIVLRISGVEISYYCN